MFYNTCTIQYTLELFYYAEAMWQPVYAMPLVQHSAVNGYGYYGTLIGNLTLEVKLTGQRATHNMAARQPELAEKTMKPLLALLQKHPPGGYTIDMPPSNCHWWGLNISLSHRMPRYNRWQCRPVAMALGTSTKLLYVEPSAYTNRVQV